MTFFNDLKDEILHNLSLLSLKSDILEKKSFIFACIFFEKNFENICEKTFIYNDIEKLYIQFLNDLYNDKNIKLIKEDYQIFIEELSLQKEKTILKIFLSLYFILHGKIYDPEKEYRLELFFNNEIDCNIIFTILKDFNFKIFKRRKDYVLYLHESESIEDFLTFINATKSSMSLMQIKIYKSLRNDVNRLINCETYNISKTVNAASRQIEDIKYIVDEKGWEFIPDDLIDIALIRFQNPEMSLSEMDKYLEVSIGKSAINNRLKKLSKIANKLRKG